MSNKFYAGLTDSDYKSIEKFLNEAIKNNYKCAHCKYNDNGICFFSIDCYLNDMKHYDDEDEDDNNDYYPEYIGYDV